MSSQAAHQALEGVGAGRGGDAAAGADVHDVLHAARCHQALQLQLRSSQDVMLASDLPNNHAFARPCIFKGR